MSTKKRLVWFDLNSSYSHSSLALPAIHAQCEQEHDEVEWIRIEATSHTALDKSVSDLIAQQPDIVCATAWLFTHNQLLEVLHRFKTLSPHTILFLGGPEFLGENEAYLRQNRWVDLLFRGEAEEVFPQWLRVFDQKEKWATLDGLCYIDENDCYIDRGTASVKEFAKLRPAYQSCFFPSDKPFVQFETNRGCYNTCSFCVSGKGSQVQHLSFEQIEEALSLFVEKGIQEVRLLDRTFNSNPQRAIRTLRLFEQFATKLSFHLEIHPALLTQELREVIHSLPEGLLHLEVGIQSLSQEVITGVTRKGNVTDVLKGLDFLLSQPHFETHTDLIAGLPGYTLTQLYHDTLELIRRRAGEIQIELLKLLPGTPIREHADQWGILYAQTPPYEVLQTPQITFAELQQAMKISRTIDLYYNPPHWQSLIRRGVEEDPTFLERFIDHLDQKNAFDQPMSLERRSILLAEFIESQQQNLEELLFELWITHGLSANKLSGCSSSQITTPAGDSGSHIHSPQLRVYLYQWKGYQLTVGFDRSISQGRPIWIKKSEEK